MSAVRIVEALDEVEDGEGGFRSSMEVSAVETLDFQGAPEGFRQGIVVTVGASAHAGNQRGSMKSMTIFAGGILNAAGARRGAGQSPRQPRATLRECADSHKSADSERRSGECSN